jgi:hypothetical protein
VPVQNEATLYRAEALERLAVIVAEAQKAGEVATRSKAARTFRRESEARTPFR